jgi:hypothetical protein
MAETHSNKREDEDTEVPARWVFSTNATPKYQQGDYLRIELLSEVAGRSMSIWMYVDHCDDQHAIVFGTIDSEPSEWLGSAFRSGAKLAVSYRQVREHRQSW